MKEGGAAVFEARYSVIELQASTLESRTGTLGERVSFRPHVRGMVPSRAVTVRGRNRISARVKYSNKGKTRRARVRWNVWKIQNACRNDATRSTHRARCT